MKKLTILFIITLIALTTIQARAEVNVNTGMEYEWWESKKYDYKGHQTYIPIKVDGMYKAFSFGVLGGFASTEYEPGFVESTSISHALDTKVNLSYEFALPLYALKGLIGLDINLPTGKDRIKSKKLDIMMEINNPDLFSIINLGEGLNINPTLSLVREWDNWEAGIGIGYLFRGKYKYSIGEQEYGYVRYIDEYEPGEVLNIVSEVGYDISTKWLVRVFTNYAHFNKDKYWVKEAYYSFYSDYYDYNNERTGEFHEGEFLLLGAGAHYFEMNWDVDISIKGIFRDKRKFYGYPPKENWWEYSVGLYKEAKKSIGDEWIVDLTLNYFIDAQTLLTSKLEYIRIDKNDYLFEEPYFQNKQEKISIGIDLTRRFTNGMKGRLGIKGIKKKDRAGYYYDSESYKGLAFEVMLTKAF